MLKSPVGGAHSPRSSRWWLRAVGAPDLSDRQRRALQLTIVLSLVGEYGTILDSLALGSVRRSLDMSEDAVAYVSSVVQLGEVLMVVWGVLTDILGRRVFFLIGLPLTVVQLAAVGCATGSKTYMAALLLGRLLPRPPAFAYLVEQLEPEGRGALATLVAVGAAVGAGGALLVWAVIGDRPWGWRAMYLAEAAIVLPFAVSVHARDRSWLPESRLFVAPKGRFWEKAIAPFKSLWVNSWSILLVFCVVTVLQNLTITAPGKFVFDHLSECGYASSTASAVATIGGILSLPVLVVAGIASDRWGRVPTGALMWVGTGLSYALYYTARCGTVMLPSAFVLVVVIAQFCRSAITQTLEQECWSTEHRVTAGSVYSLLSGIFGSIGFVLYPLISQRAGHGGALSILSLGACLIGVVWLFLPETARKSLRSRRGTARPASACDDEYVVIPSPATRSPQCTALRLDP
eukprot:TRINITY_DN2273_c1_g3_i1.p1 TRINITY_DN2273_c1_g3~~TRINITY_DN2273_c1_g3_i1.p1  ORF type:complete len:503 (+),score=106.99 TRINITY_DN2273_c1_g3_i1:129-1511(+)